MFGRHVKQAKGWEPMEVALEDDDDPLWNLYGVDIVPTVVFFDDGAVVRRLDGRAGVGLREADLVGAISAT